MPYRVGEMIFPDWFREYFNSKRCTDTFVIPISSRDGLPPDNFADLIRQFGTPLYNLRPTASLWVQVDAPGLWYPLEIRRRLTGMAVPVAVSRTTSRLIFRDFDRFSITEKMPAPQFERTVQIPLEAPALDCVKVLARLGSGLTDEIASLAGIGIVRTESALDELERKGYVYHMPPGGHHKKHTDLHPYSDARPYWKINRLGTVSALRSWGIPSGFRGSPRLESYRKAGFRHQHVARMWPAWLNEALPHAEIWSGWSEIYLPDAHVTPDGLAWGKLYGRETLFWLEVESGHKSTERVLTQIRRRFRAATDYVVRRKMRLVFALLAMPWVQNATRLAFEDMHPDVAVVIADWKSFGHLPVIDWGRARPLR
jgi:hypothetical protein